MAITIMCCFLSALGLGTFLTFSSSHWFLAWMGLEINTLAVIPLMMNSNCPRSSEAAAKYFFMQAMAAMTFLFAAATNAWLIGEWNIYLLSTPKSAMIMTLAIFAKLAVSPLHIWFPDIIQGLDYTTALILTTWQKLAPFIVLMQLPLYCDVLMFIGGIASVLFGGWAGMNQTQLRKLLAYSSISQLGWMVMVMEYSRPLALLSLVTYIVMTAVIFSSFQLLGAKTINQLATTSTKYTILVAAVLLVLLSLGGLPPLTGFLPKLLILDILSQQPAATPAILMALGSLLSLYFYLRICYAAALTTPPNNSMMTPPWRAKRKKIKLWLVYAICFSAIVTPLAPELFPGIF